MVELSEIDGVLRRRLSVGEVTESSSSASSSVEGGRTLWRAEMRYAFTLGEGVDLAGAVEAVAEHLRRWGATVEHQPARREQEGRRVCGSIFFQAERTRGELDYRLAHDDDAGRVTVDLSLREKEGEGG